MLQSDPLTLLILFVISSLGAGYLAIIKAKELRWSLIFLFLIGPAAITAAPVLVWDIAGRCVGDACTGWAYFAAFVLWELSPIWVVAGVLGAALARAGERLAKA